MADAQVTADPDRVVLTFQWRDSSAGLMRSETFGPWVADEDETHLAAIRDFVLDWQRLTGLKADVVTMAIAFDPDAWIREQESGAAMTAEAAEAVTSQAGQPEFSGVVIIEWPPPAPGGGAHRPLPGWGCAILDAGSGKPVTTVEKISIPAVTAEANDFITCWLTMFADDDGNPVLFPEEIPGRPGSVKACLDESGNVRTGKFPFLVAEMRVRQ